MILLFLSSFFGCPWPNQSILYVLLSFGALFVVHRGLNMLAKQQCMQLMIINAWHMAQVWNTDIPVDPNIHPKPAEMVLFSHGKYNLWCFKRNVGLCLQANEAGTIVRGAETITKKEQSIFRDFSLVCAFPAGNGHEEQSCNNSFSV